MPKLPAQRTRSYFRLSTFEDEILVECPVCQRCARATAPAYDRPKKRYVLRVSCLRCGAQNDLPADYNFDFWTRVPLWLRTSSCGEVLWVLNERHLTALEAFIGAGLRDTRVGPLRTGPVYGQAASQGMNEQRDNPDVSTRRWQRMNSHMYSRLPAWMTSAKNRTDVLRGLRKLRTKLEKTKLR